MNDQNDKKKNHWLTKLNWPGAVAIILSTGIALSMVLAGVLPLLRDRSVGEHGATVLSTLFGAAIGALATYLGQATARIKASKDENENE